MNFSVNIKNEILNKPAKEIHCKKAFLSGLIRGSGVLFENDGNLGIEFKVSDEKTLEIVVDYFKLLFNYTVSEVSVNKDRLNNKDNFFVSIIGDNSLEVLKSLGVIKSTSDGISVNYDMFEVAKEECCFKAFMRGLFVSCGNCSVADINEKNVGYHLELVFSHYKTALEVSERVAEYGIITKITRRKDSFIVYIKSAEEIKDFLAFLPTPLSVLKITDIIIEREISNNSNRQANCDLGNVNKQVEASSKQISAILKIDKIIGLSTLKSDLLQVAIARKENKEDTLSELAEKLNLSKSCLNHRLRKLVAIADEL